jgi:hypothetical protein
VSKNIASSKEFFHFNIFLLVLLVPAKEFELTSNTFFCPHSEFAVELLPLPIYPIKTIFFMTRI